MESIAENLVRVEEEIAAAVARAGRSRDDVQLIAVSKTHAAEKVEQALAAGQILFGESRVQEARSKIPLLPSRSRWHFLGHLQKNKIRQALSLFEMFHGLDSLSLAEDMQRIADEEGVQPRVLLEVNVAGEASKYGFSPEALRQDLEQVLSLGRLTVEGLMTIPPFAPKAEASRRYFAAVRELRDRLETEFKVGLPRLSMGMSGDYAVAIEEGATLVRVGTAIFGDRSRAKPA